MSGYALAGDSDCVHLRLFQALTCRTCPEPAMDELSSVLREVLRALGMEGGEHVHPPTAAEGSGAQGDGAGETSADD